MSRVRFFGDVDNSEEEEDNDDMSSVTTNVGGVAPSSATRKKGSGISVELPVSADELLLKVTQIFHYAILVVYTFFEARTRKSGLSWLFLFFHIFSLNCSYFSYITCSYILQAYLYISRNAKSIKYTRFLKSQQLY